MGTTRGWHSTLLGVVVVLVARAAGTRGRCFVPDSYAFGLICQGVLIEGLEVVFIVITLGASQGSIPLARVPENTIKFAVG